MLTESWEVWNLRSFFHSLSQQILQLQNQIPSISGILFQVTIWTNFSLFKHVVAAKRFKKYNKIMYYIEKLSMINRNSVSLITENNNYVFISLRWKRNYHKAGTDILLTYIYECRKCSQASRKGSGILDFYIQFLTTVTTGPIN